MATRISGTAPADRREALFFFIMALIMAAAVVAGFAFQNYMGRSTFAVPAIYHVHAGVFLGWLAIYVTQNGLVASGNVAMHRRVGRLAAYLVPVMVVLAIWLTFVTLRRLGGPPSIAQPEFLFVNILHILAFAGLAFAAILMRRRTDWHRRLMFGAMATLAVPGVARLLPLPLFIPHVFPAIFAAGLIFPAIGMIADLRIRGRVHPAWAWAVVVPIAALSLGMAIASTSWATAYVANLVAGTTGAERPLEAFNPPM
jgi:hypothetical protein